MVLIYGNEETWKALEAEGMESVHDVHRALLAETRASGELIEAQGLTTSGSRVVQVRDNAPAVTDGPFTEAKEVLAGYYLFECDLERATELAGRLVEARYSPVEVRGIIQPFDE
ncbi:YciI family protein [Kribbella sp. ALI-6-A]|uniref:YciI family protein n=1 Tax=Kribbella sp. ALI-6-A TaxID=1933817 RepID=UPI001EDBE6F2|nr:YciI family protein [Kribbella sp. ALI-6-A]